MSVFFVRRVTQLYLQTVSDQFYLATTINTSQTVEIALTPVQHPLILLSTPAQTKHNLRFELSPRTQHHLSNINIQIQ